MHVILFYLNYRILFYVYIYFYARNIILFYFIEYCYTYYFFYARNNVLFYYLLSFIFIYLNYIIIIRFPLGIS